MKEEKPKIAILGWGSLLWDLDGDFSKWVEPWEFDGPTIPIEFSRISGTREGALTLVIDQKKGVPTPVAWCLTKQLSLRRFGLNLCIFVNPGFTNQRFFKLADWFKNVVFCKPWVVKLKES